MWTEVNYNFLRAECPDKSERLQVPESAVKDHPSAPNTRSQGFTTDLSQMKPQEKGRPRKLSLPQVPR